MVKSSVLDCLSRIEIKSCSTDVALCSAIFKPSSSCKGLTLKG